MASRLSDDLRVPAKDCLVASETFEPCEDCGGHQGCRYVLKSPKAATASVLCHRCVKSRHVPIGPRVEGKRATGKG